MAKRQRDWARRATLELRAALGGKCAHCGATVDLTFDVILPDTWHHRIEWSWRISFYRRELSRGNLQLLCNPCNATKGDRRYIKTLAGMRQVYAPGKYYPRRRRSSP